MTMFCNTQIVEGKKFCSDCVTKSGESQPQYTSPQCGYIPVQTSTLKKSKKLPVIFVVVVAVFVVLSIIGHFLPDDADAITGSNTPATTRGSSSRSSVSDDITPFLGSWIYGAAAGGFDTRGFAMDIGFGNYGGAHWSISNQIGAQYAFRADGTFDYFWNSNNLKQKSRGKFRVNGNKLILFDIVEDVERQYTNKRVDDRTYVFEFDHNEWGRRLTTTSTSIDFSLTFRNEQGKDDPLWAGPDPNTSREPVHFTGDITPIVGIWAYLSDNIAPNNFWAFHMYKFNSDKTFEHIKMYYDRTASHYRGKFGVRKDELILYDIVVDRTGSPANQSASNEIYNFELRKNQNNQPVFRRITPPAYIGANSFTMDFVNDNDNSIISAVLNAIK